MKRFASAVGSAQQASPAATAGAALHTATEDSQTTPVGAPRKAQSKERHSARAVLGNWGAGVQSVQGVHDARPCQVHMNGPGFSAEAQ
jgi:hypothetical protein